MTYITAALHRALIRTLRDSPDLLKPEAQQRLLRELLSEGVYLKELKRLPGQRRKAKAA